MARSSGRAASWHFSPSSPSESPVVIRFSVRCRTRSLWGAQTPSPTPEDPTVTFSGSTDTLHKGDVLTVGADGDYSGHVWRLNGQLSHPALTPTGSSATIDTSHLDHGAHTVSVVVAEGHSAQFSFLVKDRP